MQFFSNKETIRATERIFNQKKYLVAPVSMLQVGVFNEYLALEEELGKFPMAWNGRPITLNHPQRDGQYVSANMMPEMMLEALGQIWNTIFHNGLKAEIWIDVEKAEAMGGEALKAVNKLRKGEALEVSTGFFADVEEQKGTLGSKTYRGIWRNIRPDHLALLPNSVGACNWNDGCGTPRVNESSCNCQKGKAMNEEEANQEVEKEVITHTAATRIADETFVSAVVNGLLSALGRGKQTISANAEEDEDMAGINTETPAVEVPVVAKQEQSADALVGIATLLEKLNQRIDDIDAKLTANADKERNELVATLADNERCPFDEAELKALSTAHLQKLATAYQPADYSLGAGVVANRSKGDQFETLAMPEWVVAGKDN